MIILPAIDILDQQPVRLYQGVKVAFWLRLPVTLPLSSL